ncbi:MAG: DUF4339 domain-containing protein [Planctomycetaceae bacterium]|jgi:hypothetical protein|nr:DUF4339 domain-containing protein [Planctomycetaceae bacterium]
MGIRFFCPNGHKLNVKEYLAGKAGFCPECGARLIIPLQSTRKSNKELNELQERQENVPNVDSISSATPAQPQPPETNSTTTETAPIANPNEIINPILQDQTVVWYVQVLGGEQYGPVNGQTIHAWIQERRMKPSMLVWREGWTNWLEAKNVFTELDAP